MRTADEIFDHHLEVFGAGDMDGILSDYCDGSLMMYGEQTWHGLDGARDFFQMWLDDLIPAGSEFCLTGRSASADMLYITWTAESDKYVFEFGTNTFIMKDDRIWRQSVATYHRARG